MRRLMIMALALSLAACSENPLQPDGESPDLHRTWGRGFGTWGLRVMTRNVYVGADVDAVLAAQDPTQIPVLVAQAFQQLLSTNFPERARALAREIQRAKPHLVGLQEISTIRIQSPGDAVVGGTTPAEDVVFDYLSILMSALAELGEQYSVVARVQNPDIEVPMATSPTTFDDVRLTDYDVILARHGVEISDVVEQNYIAALPVPQFGITIPRGFTAVTATLKHGTYRFVNTHLEPASIPEILPVQLGQAQELIGILAGEANPIVLVGDLNTHAPTGETYQLLLANGYIDAWTTRHRRGEGFTCCHASDLMNAEVNFDRRIDLIMGRPVDDGGFRAPIVRVTGDHPRERTPSGLWPSDHGGVWAALRFTPHKWTQATP